MRCLGPVMRSVESNNVVLCGSMLSGDAALLCRIASGREQRPASAGRCSRDLRARAIRPCIAVVEHAQRVACLIQTIWWLATFGDGVEKAPVEICGRIGEQIER